MAILALRIKTKAGLQLINTLTSDSTIKDLRRQLADATNIPEERIYVLNGFPPKPFDITRDEIALSESGLKSGDTLILEEKPQPPTEEGRHHVAENCEFPGVLLKHIVPADNSCLFSSIYFVLNGKVDESGVVAPYLRKVIAETVAGDPEKFCEAILGKPNADYCQWIQDDKAWGGAIEVSILSDYYGIEIAVVDTINAIINRFGEDQSFAHRVFLLFDGIHYDPLYVESHEGGNIQTIFPTEDERILLEAEQLAKEAKSSRQFTDVDKFTLKCLVCNVMMSGQVQAQQHAQSTGHTKFGEV